MKRKEALIVRCQMCNCKIETFRSDTKFCSSKCRMRSSRIIRSSKAHQLKRSLEAKPLIDDVRNLLSTLDNLLPGSLDKGQKLFVKECRHASIKYLQYQIDNS